jgi:hypothetical protein
VADRAVIGAAIMAAGAVLLLVLCLTGSRRAPDTLRLAIEMRDRITGMTLTRRSYDGRLPGINPSEFLAISELLAWPMAPGDGDSDNWIVYARPERLELWVSVCRPKDQPKDQP